MGFLEPDRVSIACKTAGAVQYQRKATGTARRSTGRERAMKPVTALAVILCLRLPVGAQQAGPVPAGGRVEMAKATWVVDAGEPARPVSPMLYGIFFEDINHAADASRSSTKVSGGSLSRTETYTSFPFSPKPGKASPVRSK